MSYFLLSEEKVVIWVRLHTGEEKNTLYEREKKAKIERIRTIVSIKEKERFKPKYIKNYNR